MSTFRQFHKRAPMVSFLLLLISGIIFQHYLSIKTTPILLIALVLIPIIWLVRSKRLLILLLTLIFFTGMIRYSLIQKRFEHISNILNSFDKKEVQLVGKIKTRSKTKKGVKYLIENQTIATDSFRWEGDVKFHLYSDKDEFIPMGTVVKGVGEFKQLRGPRNPGEFDFQSFYQRKNIWGIIFQDKKTKIIIVDSTQYSFSEWVENVRQSVKTMFERSIGGEAGSLMTALIVGLREEIPKEIKQDFVDTGVIHVLAVSGLHVGYVLVIFLPIVKLFRIPYGWDKIAVVFTLITFAIFTGGKASVLRAVIMASLYVIAPLFNRKANLWNIIAVTAIGLLVYNPAYLFDLGFLLSFTAVASIVFFYKQFEKVLPERTKISNIKNPVLKYMFALFLVSLSAQIGTLPFTWMFFNRIPIISLMANVIIVPLIGLLVALGFAIVLLGSWLPFLANTFGSVVWLLSQIIFWLTHSFASLPVAFIDIKTPSVINILQYITIIAFLFTLIRPVTKRKSLLLLVFWLNLIVWPWILHRPALDIIFLDVGQGDGAIIRIPTSFWGKSKIMIIDAGEKKFGVDKGEKVVLPTLKHLGVKKVNLIVMTHPHSDHIGGVEALLENTQVEKIWDTRTTYRSKLYQRILTRIEQDSIPYLQMTSGKWVDDYSPLQVFVIHPDSTFAKVEDNVNNMSVVTKLVYGDVSLLFVGDLEKEGDWEMLSFGDLNRSNVLKVGHHGSITSTTQQFLNLVQPEYAVVSVGEGNKFNHPSELVLKRLRLSGATVCRTDLEGAIWLKTDGNKIWRHYW